MTRIRVAHCLEQVRSGGVERRRLSLARRLDRECFEQIVICTEAEEDLRREFATAGCTIFSVGPMQRGIDFPRIRAAAKLLREFEPDIVHGAVFEGVILATLGGRLAKVPVVIAEETIAPVGRRLTGHLYFRLLTSLADKVIAISDAVSNYLTERLHIPRDKIRLIYNGVADPGPAAPTDVQRVRAQFGLTKDHPVIGTIGRLAGPRGQGPDAHKRIGDAVAAMPRILKRFPNAKLLIVGDGPDRSYLEEQAVGAGLGESVIFAGFQPRVRPFLACMDLLVHPSISEGLPLVLVEAMFASLPVVATNVPGSNEVVVDGKTGLLVPAMHPDALARSIVKLLQDKRLCARMGHAGFRRARELFSEDRYVNEIAKLYKEAAAKRARRRETPQRWP